MREIIGVVSIDNRPQRVIAIENTDWIFIEVGGFGAQLPPDAARRFAREIIRLARKIEANQAAKANQEKPDE